MAFHIYTAKNQISINYLDNFTNLLSQGQENHFLDGFARISGQTSLEMQMFRP